MRHRGTQRDTIRRQRQTQTVGEWDRDTVESQRERQTGVCVCVGGGGGVVQGGRDRVCPTKKTAALSFLFHMLFYSGCVHKHVSMGRKSNTIRSRKRHLHVFTYVQYNPVHHIVYILHCIVPFCLISYIFIHHKEISPPCVLHIYNTCTRPHKHNNHTRTCTDIHTNQCTST